MTNKPSPKKLSKKHVALIAAVLVAILAYLSQDEAVAPAPEPASSASSAPSGPVAPTPAPSASAGG